ncbi:NAD(P)H-binding protein [Streptomyces sp. NBC_01012]|uniref:NAD(P)H-binding protein n=1 Tax=Streptomyces sp. NBC_01012 TaxID=2903717 RepID=UPI00386E2798|nr:NAD(P)H-binding protein [Streptomyces sp. NBC_01012]
MIVVTGVAGELARLTVGRLVERLPAAEVVGTSRTPEKAAGLPIEVRAADFGDPASLVTAFDGADALLIVSLHPLPERSRLQANAIEAAVEAGVGHVVYTSFTRAGEPDNPVSVVPDHRLAEQALLRSGTAFTALRFNMWPEMLLLMGTARRAVSSGKLLSNSGSGGVGYVTKDDSAAVAAAVLAQGSDKGELLEVSGPAAVTDAELARILTEVTGRTVGYEAASDEAVAAALLADGLLEPMANALAANGVARRDGWYGATTRAVERLTGREPTSLGAFLARHRAALTTA